MTWTWRSYEAYRQDGLTLYHEALKKARLLRPRVANVVDYGSVCLREQLGRQDLEFVEVVW